MPKSRAGPGSLARLGQREDLQPGAIKTSSCCTPRSACRRPRNALDRAHAPEPTLGIVTFHSSRFASMPRMIRREGAAFSTSLVLLSMGSLVPRWRARQLLRIDPCELIPRIPSHKRNTMRVRPQDLASSARRSPGVKALRHGDKLIAEGDQLLAQGDHGNAGAKYALALDEMEFVRGHLVTTGPAGCGPGDRCHDDTCDCGRENMGLVPVRPINPSDPWGLPGSN